jgi:O-antigen ligase
MSSINRTWQSAGAFAGGSLPPSDSLVRSESDVRSRTAREPQLYVVFQYVLLAYLFMYVSRLPELVPWLRIGKILLPVLLVGLFLTGRTRVLLDVRSGRWLMGFTIWVAICVPFSFWPGGSFQTLVNTLQSLFMVVFVLAFVRSVRDVMRALNTVALASGAIAILSFVSSSQIQGRQGVGGTSSLDDPNYFALYLLVGVALLCLTASQNRGWLRLCALALIPINLAGVARSGSRSGLIALGAGLIMLLVYGSAKQRAMLAWACLIGVLLAAFFLPQSIKVRFTTWLTPSGFRTLLTGERTREYDISHAQGSTEGRLYQLRRSLILTAEHPIFGVGPDQFQGAEAADAKAHGEPPTWHETHNLYTQMSSELGIPGLILFAGALFGGYRGLSAIRKRGPTRHIRQMALFLQTAYFMLMFGAFFLSLGFGGLPFLLIGLSASFKLAVRRYKKESRAGVLRPEVSVAV